MCKRKAGTKVRNVTYNILALPRWVSYCKRYKLAVTCLANVMKTRSSRHSIYVNKMQGQIPRLYIIIYSNLYSLLYKTREIKVYGILSFLRQETLAYSSRTQQFADWIVSHPKNFVSLYRMPVKTFDVIENKYTDNAVQQSLSVTTQFHLGL